MARMRVAPVSMDVDEGHPVSRCVDGTNVRECSSQEGSFLHFGKIRKGMRTWSNSKTGKREQPPPYVSTYDDDLPHNGY